MVTQRTRDILAANAAGRSGANPVADRPGLGRWLKSQLPGGERARSFRELPGVLKRAVTSPAMLRNLERGALSIVGGGAPLGIAIADRERGERALARLREPVKAVMSGDPVGRMIPGRAGELIRGAVAGAGETIGVGANPLKLRDRAEDVEAGVAPVVSSAWYPPVGQDWSGEPGGKYLSQRYPREFGTWGVGTPGEGWAHIAERGGWDKHIHPIYSEGALGAIMSRPYRSRSSARAYVRY